MGLDIIPQIPQYLENYLEKVIINSNKICNSSYKIITHLGDRNRFKVRVRIKYYYKPSSYLDITYEEYQDEFYFDFHATESDILDKVINSIKISRNKNYYYLPN